MRENGLPWKGLECGWDLDEGEEGREAGVWEVVGKGAVERVFCWSQTSLGLNPQVSCPSFLNLCFSLPRMGIRRPHGSVMRVLGNGQYRTCCLSEAGGLNMWSLLVFILGRRNHVGERLGAGLCPGRQAPGLRLA